MAAAAMLAIAACDLVESVRDPISDSARNRAFELWQETCEDDEDTSVYSDRAFRGDPEALDCLILFRRFTMTQFSDAERQEVVELTGEDPAVSAEDIRFDRSRLFEHLYVRWRLTGERLDELEAVAREMTKAEIDGALVLTSLDPDLLPGRKTDPCGRTAPEDPGYRFVLLGSGDRDPADCGARPQDGSSAG